MTSRIRWQFFQYIKLCEDEGIRSDIGAARGAGLLTGVGKNLLAAGRLAGKTPLPAAAEAPSPASATAPGADWVLGSALEVGRRQGTIDTEANASMEPSCPAMGLVRNQGQRKEMVHAYPTGEHVRDRSGRSIWVGSGVIHALGAGIETYEADLMQSDDGRLTLRAVVPQAGSEPLVGAFVSSRDNRVGVEGTGLAGGRLDVQDAAIVDFDSAHADDSELSAVLLHCPRAAILWDLETQPVRIVFRMVNATFGSSTRVLEPDLTRTYELTVTDPSGSVLHLQSTESMRQTLKHLEEAGGVGVTAKLTGAGGLTEDEALLLGNDFSLLLSLATNNKVNWLSCEWLDANGKAVKTVVQSPNVRGFQRGPANVAPSRLPHFLARGLEHIDTARGRWRVHEAANIYLDAMAQSGFLELRGLRLVVCLEFLVATYASREKCEYLMSTEEFKVLKKELKGVAGEILKAQGKPS